MEGEEKEGENMSKLCVLSRDPLGVFLQAGTHTLQLYY